MIVAHSATTSASEMKPEPKEPASLHPLAREILVELSRAPQASGIIIGGGVALQHYCEHRDTVDLDAWWAAGAGPETERAIRDAMETVAGSHALELTVRAWRETTSFELKAAAAARKVFSFQISRRTIELSPPFDSAWAPVKIEAFDDNLGAKMTALVDRGAPRDLLDVREVCRRGLASAGECWGLWQRKNPAASADEAKLKVLHHLLALEARRPLGRIADQAAREAARDLRAWVRTVLCGSRRSDADGD